MGRQIMKRDVRNKMSRGVDLSGSGQEQVRAVVSTIM